MSQHTIMKFMSNQRAINSLFSLNPWPDRLEAITNLNMNVSEDLQVVNYGIGGHYEPHFDFARKTEPDAFRELGTGNRIATILFYLSDVPAGTMHNGIEWRKSAY